MASIRSGIGENMEDRYLFKAKRIDNVEWVEGYLIYSNKDCYICEKPYECMDEYSSLNGQSYGFGGFKLVDPSTICQCTGLKDKNGNLIWENDIVKGKYYDNGKSHRHIGQVKYTCESYKVVGVKQYTGYHARLDGSYEVIGNIFDNPDLLESEG